MEQPGGELTSDKDICDTEVFELRLWEEVALLPRRPWGSNGNLLASRPPCCNGERSSFTG